MVLPSDERCLGTIAHWIAYAASYFWLMAFWRAVALGVVVYHVLTDYIPFRGSFQRRHRRRLSLMEYVKSWIKQPPWPPLPKPPIPQWLLWVLLQGAASFIVFHHALLQWHAWYCHRRRQFQLSLLRQARQDHRRLQGAIQRVRSKHRRRRRSTYLARLFATALVMSATGGHAQPLHALSSVVMSTELHSRPECWNIEFSLVFYVNLHVRRPQEN